MIGIGYVDERLVVWRKRVKWYRRIARLLIPVVVVYAVVGRFISAGAFAVSVVGWELLARSSERHVRWLLEQAARIEMEGP